MHFQYLYFTNTPVNSTKFFFIVFAFLYLVVSNESVEADWPLYRGNVGADACAPESVSLPATLKIKWEHRLEKGWFEATPIIAEGTVYIGSSEEGLLAFTLAEGKPLWTYPHSDGVMASASYLKNAKGDALVCFSDSNGFLIAVNARDGVERWKFEVKGSIDSAPNFDSVTNRVLIGSQRGTLYAIDATTGTKAWEYTTGDQIRCFPSIADRVCFVAGCDGQLHVVDLDRGESIAQVPLDAPTGSTPAVLGNRVYFGTEGNEFLAIDWREKKVLWRFQGAQTFRGPAACVKGTVIFSGMDRMVRALDSERGEERWIFRTQRRMEHSGPVIVGSRVYVPCSDSGLYVLDLETGRKLAEIELTGKLLGSPAVAEGRMVIGTDQGVLTCLE